MQSMIVNTPICRMFITRSTSLAFLLKKSTNRDKMIDVKEPTTLKNPSHPPTSYKN